MAKARKKARRGRRRRHVRGGRCGVERVRGHRRMVCRNKRGQITKSHKVTGHRRRRAHKGRKHRKSGLHCPKRFQGHPVHVKRLRRGGSRCYIKRATGALRWVARVRRR